MTQVKVTSINIISRLRDIVVSLEFDDRENLTLSDAKELLHLYNSLVQKLVKSDVKQHAELKKARASYLTAQASVATFLAAVQITFIAFTTPVNGKPSNTIQSVIDIFSFCALSFDIMGAMSALTTTQALLKLCSRTDQFMQDKSFLEEKMHEQLNSDLFGVSYEEEREKKRREELVAMLDEVLKTSDDLSTLDLAMKQHAHDNTTALLIIILGVICLFCSLITFIINSQRRIVWVPTAVVVGVTTFFVVKCETDYRTESLKSMWRDWRSRMRRWLRRERLEPSNPMPGPSSARTPLHPFSHPPDNSDDPASLQMPSGQTSERGQSDEEKEDKAKNKETPMEKLQEDHPDDNDPRDPEATNTPSKMDRYRFYWTHILPTEVALICPWLFFGLVKHHGGVPFSHPVSRWVNHHPKDNNFIFTTISSILMSIVSLLFANAVANLAQKWIAHNDTDIFGLSFFIGLKNRSFPWQFKWPYVRHLTTQRLFWVLVLYIIMFNYITTSSISSLITPGRFSRHADVQGQELDFGASGPECVTWFSENILNDTCNWASYKGGQFTTCLVENQLTDVLESGRSNILSSQSNTSISVTMAQLGLQFLGPMRGVLPNGPNGIPQFNTIRSSVSFDASPGTDLTYNYTLQLQGLTSKVSCAYATDTPIKYGTLPPWWTYSGTCDSGQDFLGVQYFMVPPLLTQDNNTLGFWACRTGHSYIVYLTGGHGYSSSIGNITCMISSIQPAVFPVKYTGKRGFFSTEAPTSFSPGTSSELVSKAIKSLGAVIQEAQGMVFNEFAESVLNLGVKSFGVQPHYQSNTSLRLFEAMISGIIEYEATYIRLLYTASQTPLPVSCLRKIDGFVDYEVIGWFVNSHDAYYLIPLTILNITSLLMLIGALFVGKKRLFGFDPTLQNFFIFGKDQFVQVDPSEPHNWPKKIEHGPTVEGKGGFRLKD